MPIKLSNMAADRASATFEYPDDTGPQQVHITFYARRVTANMLDQLAFFMDMDEMDDAERGAAGPLAVKALSGMLAQLLIKWDVLGDNGKALPTSAEVIGSMPVDFLIACLQAILAGFRLGE